MGRYDPLRDFLAGRPPGTEQVRTTFADVEALVGPLPASAREHRAWWANDSKVEAQAWRAAGWHVDAVNQSADTSTKEQGIDVLATRTGRTLAVEVKGFPGRRYAGPRRAEEVKPTTPTTQARH